ncbi:MAG: FAD-binding protein [Oscillospiraceae bacterium]|nr:FAD-binding protein [Oscillospiraceae bacterium]
MKTLETDVIVVAAGPSGLAACVSAAENGAQVICFEKGTAVGGTANMGMGPFGVESRVQKRMMINLKKEEVFRRFMDYVHWQADAKLVHDYFWLSGNTIDWLEDMGVVFAGAMKNFPDSEPTWHVVMPEGGGKPGPRCASAMNKVMYERAMELGVEFYLETPVYELIKDGDEVVGVRAKDKDGEEIEAWAGAVIIATGGFGTNPDMIKEYTGFTMHENITTFEVPGVVGDGIKMAWAAGAGKSRMEMERIIGMPLPGAMVFQRPQSTIFNQGAAIAINRSGYRVCDESVMQNMSVGANIIGFQQGRELWRMLDSDAVEYYRTHELDFPSEVFQDDPTVDFEETWEKWAKEFPNDAFAADSVEELAKAMGVNVENLVATVEQYNKFCDMNYDDDFNKDRNYLHPLRGKKFYAMRYSSHAYGSCGGIKVDHTLRAITQDYVPIPGLYAVGMDVCDIYNGTYDYYFPGNSMGFCVNTGRIAGKNAAEYANRPMEDE